MPKFPRLPRVSILVPLEGDQSRFEQTLLSVLENQPEGCEILAIHNGTYPDPFNLGDEVEFVTARSSSLVDAVRDAFPATRAPVVHILGQGVQATPDWLSAGLDTFAEPSVGAVAPGLVNGSTKTCGWQDTPGRLCQPHRIRKGGTNSGEPDGFFLHACFVRRRLLGQMLDAVAPALVDPIAVSYAFGLLAERCGWRVAGAADCLIDAAAEMAEHPAVFERGQSLAAIRSHLLPDRRPLALGSMLREALVGGGSLGECLGMMRHTSQLPAMRRAIDPAPVGDASIAARVVGMPPADAKSAANAERGEPRRAA